jgi:translation initiation factor 3 subunit F
MDSVDKPLFLSASTTPYENVLIQPVVIYNILDHFIRRNEQQFRVVGTLVGIINERGIVEVRNCYPVPHSESDKVYLMIFF